MVSRGVGNNAKPLLRRLLRAGVSAFCVLALPQTGLAQTASEITPESFQPPQIRLQGAVVFTGEPGVQAPPGSENLSISIADVNLVDAFPELADANAAYQTRLTRGRIAVSEIFDATSDLEAAYARAGFVLARIVLPVQRLSDGGSLRVLVVDGFVETVEAPQAPTEVRERLEEVTDRIVDKPGLTLRELERALLLAGDIPGVALGSALAAGQRPGGTVIALDPQYRSVTGFFGFDNIVSDTLGNVFFNGGLEFNSPFGLGESIYFRASGAPSGYLGDEPRLRTLAAGFALPIGSDGLLFNFEVTDSRTAPDQPIAPTTSEFERFSFRLFYPWIRSRDRNVSTQISLDRTSDTQELTIGDTTVPIYNDVLTVLRIGANASFRSASGANLQAGLNLSKGLDAFGSRGSEDVGTGTPLSRAGADAEFSKLVLAGTYQRPLGEQFALSVTGRAQVNFGDILPTSEQFSIAGPDDLSGFDSGAVRGDNGWMLRSELAWQNEIALGGIPVVLSPYVFAAAGSVRREQPTIVEAARVDAFSYGIGVDLFASGASVFQSGSLRIEYGRGERDDSGPDENRLTILGTYRF